MSDGVRRALSPEDAERAIERTRAELALTLEALDARLAPRHLVKKGTAMLMDRFDAYERLNRGADMLRANPVPVALIGLGAAWLIASNTGLVDRIAADERVERARRRVAEDAARAGDVAVNVADRAGDIASGVAERTPWPVGRAANPFVQQPTRSERWIHQATDMTQGAMRSARDTGGSALQRASDYASDSANRVGDRVGDVFERHPLMTGAIGVLAGVMLAAMLPRTRTEDELLGTTSDGLWRKAEDTARQTVTMMRDAATRAVNRASDAAVEAVDSAVERRSRA